MTTCASAGNALPLRTIVVALVLCLMAAHATVAAAQVCDLVGPTWVAEDSVSYDGAYASIRVELQFYDNGRFDMVQVVSTSMSSCPSVTGTVEGNYAIDGASMMVEYTFCQVDRPSCMTCNEIGEPFTSNYDFNSDCSALSLTISGTSYVFEAQSGLSGGAIAGIVIAVLVVVGGAIALGIYVHRKRSYQALS